MDRSRELWLISQTWTQGEFGEMQQTTQGRRVFCDVGSVSASEYFEAAQVGIAPEYRVTMFAPDYQGEQIAQLDGVTYGIYRTYRGKNETIELYLERKSGVTYGAE